MEALEPLIYARELSPVRDRMIAELDDIDTLCATYRSRIYRYALLSLRDPDLAENVTQDCFLRAYRARDEFRGDCSVATWLTRIATNLIRDSTRSRKCSRRRGSQRRCIAQTVRGRRSPVLVGEHLLVGRQAFSFPCAMERSAKSWPGRPGAPLRAGRVCRRPDPARAPPARAGSRRSGQAHRRERPRSWPSGSRRPRSARGRRRRCGRPRSR